MNVMYTCDNNYVWLMGISTISLFENNKAIDDIRVYLLGEKIDEENRLALQKIGDKYGRKIEVIDVPRLNIPQSIISARWPLSAYTRLFSGEILPSYIHRILYLDCDTIVSGDISELEGLDFNGNIAMGVKDCISGTYKINIGLESKSPYYNAGVILFNMDALRKIDINMAIENYMQKYQKLINYADQDILNGLFSRKIGELNPKYNIMTIDVVHTYREILSLRRPTNFYEKEELAAAISTPSVIHYTTNMLIIRPWFKNTNHPLANEFRKYVRMGPWKDKKFNDMVLVTKESKIIKTILKLPKPIAYWILGLIHSELRPRYTRMLGER